jgi:flagellar M-ring protein FliF
MFNDLREIWERQTASAKALLALSTLLILGVLLYLSYAVLKPDYQVLFSELDPQDAATIVAELDRMKIPYRLGADETTILVDANQVHSTRLKLMGKGVSLRGGVGFEIFNNTDFGVTEFAQKINYQRALQGELARTIMALDEVKSVRVHLVMAESGLFKKGGQKPKASITVALRENRRLQPEQVAGIQRLVAASVPQFDPASVTVLDQRGVALSRNVDPDTEEAVMRLDSKHEIEAYLTRKVVHVLDKAFGPGSAIVSVDVTLNHEQVRTTREEILPNGSDGKAPRAITRQRSSVQGAGAAPAGSASSRSAGTGTAPAAAPPAGPTAEVVAPAVVATAREQPVGTRASVTEIEYQNSRLVEQTDSRPGSVRRISVGVLLPRSLDAAKLKELTQVLSMTVGLNAARGDDIAISAVDQFSVVAAAVGVAPEVMSERSESTATEAAARANIGDERTMTFALSAAVALLLLLLIAAVAQQWRWRSRQAKPLTADERERLLAQMRQWLGAQEG